jgi:hypothetical protein
MLSLATSPFVVNTLAIAAAIYLAYMIGGHGGAWVLAKIKAIWAKARADAVAVGTVAKADFDALKSEFAALQADVAALKTKVGG